MVQSGRLTRQVAHWVFTRKKSKKANLDLW
jgi:hypothetical protein